MRQGLVQAAIERVLLSERVISARKIAHGALLKPLPMQAPLAAGINQSVTDQRSLASALWWSLWLLRSVVAWAWDFAPRP
jgi:hypothetical protein